MTDERVGLTSRREGARRRDGSDGQERRARWEGSVIGRVGSGSVGWERRIRRLYWLSEWSFSNGLLLGSVERETREKGVVDERR